MSRPFVLIALVPLLQSGCERPPDPIEPVAAQSSAAAVSDPKPRLLPEAAATAMPANAIARISLQPASGHAASGLLELQVAADALQLSGLVTGLAPGVEHGFHVHEIGDCSAPDASSAGAHFNPAGKPHGQPGADAHHAGDLPNLPADAQGRASVNLLLRGLEYGTGNPNDVRGRALVVHEKRDDYRTQPAGDSGARIACGVIDDGGAQTPETTPGTDVPAPPTET